MHKNPEAPDEGCPAVGRTLSWGPSWFLSLRTKKSYSATTQLLEFCKSPFKKWFLNSATIVSTVFHGFKLVLLLYVHGSTQDWWYIAQSQDIFNWHWEHAFPVSVKYTLAKEQAFVILWRTLDCGFCLAYMYILTNDESILLKTRHKFTSELIKF